MTKYNILAFLAFFSGFLIVYMIPSPGNEILASLLGVIIGIPSCILGFNIYYKGKDKEFQNRKIQGFIRK